MMRNEFRREFVSPVSVFFFLILPLLFTAAVASGLGGLSENGERPEAFRAELYVESRDEGPLVAEFLQAMQEANLSVHVVESRPEDAFGLKVPADFSARLRRGEGVTVILHTLPARSASQAVEQYVNAAAGRLAGAVRIAQSGQSRARDLGIAVGSEEDSAFFDDVLRRTLEATQNPPAVAEVRWPEAVEVTGTAGTGATGAEQASAGQMVTWVQITLLGAAQVLVDERERGTLRRLLVTPATRVTILGGKLLARMCLGLVQMALLLGGGALIFGVNWGEQPLATALVSVAFALATVGLGLLIATFVRTRGQASSVVVGTAMALAALGGAWYPLEITPAFYRQAVRVLPSTWAMRAYTDLLARGATVADVLPYAGVLLGFAVAFTAVGIWRFQAYE